MRNFGLIKEGFISLMEDAILTENKNKLKTVKRFESIIKENNILKLQNKIYNLFENLDSFDGDKDNNINKLTESLRSIDINLIEEANCLLLPILLEYSVDLIKLDYPEKKLHESITTFVYSDRTPSNYNRLLEHKTVIKSFLKESVEPVEIQDPVHVYQVMMESIKIKYPNLSELEVKLLASNLNEDTRKSFFTECKSLALEMIENIEDEDVSDDELGMVREKIENMDFVNESYFDNMYELINLIE